MGTLVLSAKTRKAKSRLKQWGNKWEIIRGNADSWQIIAFKDTTRTHDSIRWVNKCCDPDFEIVNIDIED